MNEGKAGPFTTFQHPLQALSKGEKVVIVGTGETAAVVFEYLSDDTPHQVVAFSTERRFLADGRYYGLPVVPFEDLPAAYPAAENRLFIAISFVRLNQVRRRLYHAAKAAGFDCVSYLSSHASVAPDVEIGENVMVQENVTVQYGAHVGANAFLGSGTSVGYGSVIGPHCYTGPHATVGGSCRVGPGSFSAPPVISRTAARPARTASSAPAPSSRRVPCPATYISGIQPGQSPATVSIHSASAAAEVGDSRNSRGVPGLYVSLDAGETAEMCRGDIAILDEDIVG
jgi:acetyltransferase-like isoleucine patch superfamily enzyme